MTGKQMRNKMNKSHGIRLSHDIQAKLSCNITNWHHLFESGKLKTFSFWYLSIYKAFQKCRINNLSLSVRISNSSPFSQYQEPKNLTAESSTAMSVLPRVICMSEPRWSVIVIRQLYPSSSSKGPTKSIATELACSSGNRDCQGYRNPCR